jgi:hypothetical protein
MAKVELRETVWEKISGFSGDAVARSEWGEAKAAPDAMGCDRRGLLAERSIEALL